MLWCVPAPLLLFHLGVLLHMANTLLKNLKSIGTVAVDIDHPKNNDMFFIPLGRSLRSKIMPFRTGPSPDTRLAQIQSIPGHRIVVDCVERKGYIVDLLGQKENARIFQQVKAALESPGRTYFAPQYLKEQQPDDEVHNLSPEEIVNWLYWMARIVEDRQAVVSKGEIPTKKDLIGTEKVRNPNFGGAPVPAYMKPKIDEEELASV